MACRLPRPPPPPPPPALSFNLPFKLKKINNNMNRIIDGVYVGCLSDSRDKEQLTKYNISHILTILDEPTKGGIKGITYLCFTASDNAAQELDTFFPQAIDFIHGARLSGGNVLVHCLAGISRSTSLVIAYITTVVELPWYEALNAVRGARRGANPNFGFQHQLKSFECNEAIKQVREYLSKKYGAYDKEKDLLACKTLLEIYEQTKLCNNIFPAYKTLPLACNLGNRDKDNNNRMSTPEAKIDN